MPLAAVWEAVKQKIDATRMRKISQACIDAVFPTRCRQCEQMYARDDHGQTAKAGGENETESFGALTADFLCPQCAKLYIPISSPLCPACGRPFISRQGIDHECPDCQSHLFSFDEARAAGLFDQSLKTMIHHYKYKGRTELVRPLGHLLWGALHRFYDPKAFDIIVPVPLHWFRQYRRGFNQAALLVRQWTTLDDQQEDLFNGAMICENVLIRRRHTLSQTGLEKHQRIENLRNAFVVRKRSAVIGQRILLIDDVLTTGATIDACAITLKRAGAASVKVLTLARTV